MTFMSLMSKIRMAPHYLSKVKDCISPGFIQFQSLEVCQSVGLAQQMAIDKFN